MSARQLHPYGIGSRNLRIDGQQAKGYEREELTDLCLRYVTKSELRALLDEMRPAPEAGPASPSASSGAPPAASASEAEGSGPGAANQAGVPMSEALPGVVAQAERLDQPPFPGRAA